MRDIDIYARNEVRNRSRDFFLYVFECMYDIAATK